MYVVFDRNEDSELFLAKVKLIASYRENFNDQLFIMNSKMHRGNSKIKFQRLDLDWLEPQKQNIIDKMSVAMGTNHQGTDLLMGRVSFDDKLPTCI